jgi:antitoxin component of RelBE/YafQ-DinJ toxin-antitoxin module
MSNTTVLNVKIDKELKRQAQEVAKSVGVPMSFVVAANLKDFIRTRTVTMTDIPQLKPEVVAELKKIERDVKKRKDLSPAFTDIDKAIEWLDSDNE